MSSVADAERSVPDSGRRPLPPARRAGSERQPRRPRRRPAEQPTDGGSGAASRTAAAARALVALSVGVVGFLVAAQLGTTRRGTENLAAESESDLTRIFSSLNEESAALRDEISQLRLELAALQSSAERDQLARDASQRQLTDLQILAGVVPARGPGVAVRIDDPKGVFEFELLLDLVQELRDAGAEAIAVNGRRVGGTTAFSSREGAVTVDGQEVGAALRGVGHRRSGHPRGRSQDPRRGDRHPRRPRRDEGQRRAAQRGAGPGPGAPPGLQVGPAQGVGASAR